MTIVSKLVVPAEAARLPGHLTLAADEATNKFVAVDSDGNVSAVGGETNTGSNVGEGAGEVFKGKVGETLQFRKVKAGDNVTITQTDDEVVIAATGGGAGEGGWVNLLGPESEFRSLAAGDVLETAQIAGVVYEGGE